MASVAEIKAAVLAKLAGGDSWIKGANARDAQGMPCPPLSPNAVKWDIFGALMVATKDDATFADGNAAYAALRDAIPADYKSRDIESYNDFADWAKIAALLQ